MSIFSNLSLLRNGQSPGQLILQITDRCNATCPQCEMRVGNAFKRSTLNLKKCKMIIDAASRNNVSAFSITGGEPLLYLDEVCTLMQHAADRGIKYTRTGTNGFMLRNSDERMFTQKIENLAEKLTPTPLRNFWISIDSSDPETHEQMRGFSGLIKGIEKALPIFHKHGLYPTANLGINRNLAGKQNNIFTSGISPKSEEQIEEYTRCVTTGIEDFFERVISLGFSMVNFCYPMSIEKNEQGLAAVYPASSAAQIVRFTPFEKSLIFKAMLEVIPKYRTKIKIFSPLSSLQTLQKIYSNENRNPFPCRGGIDYLFINASDGDTYPCGYRGTDNMGDYTKIPAAKRDKTPCTKCDWECFRDPSEFFGPLMHGFSNPTSLFKEYKRDKAFYKLWIKDLMYYKTRNYFHGRKG